MTHSGANASSPASYEPFRAEKWAEFARLRSSEWLLLAYFAYAAATRMAGLGVLALGVAALILVLARLDSRSNGGLFGIVRDWLPLPFILVAYWSVDWVRPLARAPRFEHTWIGWDRLLLNEWGGRRAMESCGSVLALALGLSYAVLWAVPPVSVGALYLWRRRERVDRFLFVLLLGTLATYALLPYFPSASPAALFPGEDLPNAGTVFRSLNQWVLERFDIRTSVFPSGHVTVAFSAAFGMLLALPEKKWVGATLLLFASAVAVETVYSRYHYAVDGLAGLLVSAAAGALSGMIRRRRRQGNSGAKNL